MTEVHDWAGRTVDWIPDPCQHDVTVPVTTCDGEHVATLCLDCDAQLPPTFDHRLSKDAAGRYLWSPPAVP